MSTHGAGSGVERARRVAVELHEDQVPDLEPAVALALDAQARRGPPPPRRRGASSPWKKWISEQGPQGPVSPIAQKLSLAPSSRMRSAGTCAQPEAVRLGVAGHAVLALEDRDLQAVLGQAEVARSGTPSA